MWNSLTDLPKHYLLLSFIVVYLLGHNPSFAQQLVLKPDHSITTWSNLEEWIFSNLNAAFRTYDMNNLEVYLPGYTNTLNEHFIVILNDHVIETSWLNNHLTFFPNLPLSAIDSIVVDQNSKSEYLTAPSNRTIRIFTRNKKSFLSEVSYANVINDPGLYTNRNNRGKSENIERINSPIRIYSSFRLGIVKSRFFYSYDDYSRTNRLIYDRNFNYTLWNRTNPPNGISIFQEQRITKHIIGVYLETKTNHYSVSSNVLYNNVPEHYIWESFSGIEIPSKFQQLNASINFKALKKSVHEITKINFSKGRSDTLSSTYLAHYGLTESRVSQSSLFRLPTDQGWLDLNIKNSYYTLKNTSFASSYSYYLHALSLRYITSLKNYLGVHLSNAGSEIQGGYHLSESNSIHTRAGTFIAGKEQYNYSITPGISNLNSSIHTVISDTEFKNSFFQFRFMHQSGFTNNRFKLSLSASHFWNYVNYEISYSRNSSSPVLNSQIRYFDSSDVGIIGLHANHRLSLANRYFITTMLTGNIDLYGNNAFRNHYKSVPKFVFSEILQYKADENFILELFFRYIPSRRIIEYKTLDEETDFPPYRVRPIPLLNFSTSMWFFDRRLETKLTLRNLLNKAEAYDTNGQYYYMSMNVSARINFGI